jgi:hypothetical protein
MPRDRCRPPGGELEQSRGRQPSLALLRFGRRRDTGADQFVAVLPVIRRALRQIDMLSRYDRDTCPAPADTGNARP